MGLNNKGRGYPKEVVQRSWEIMENRRNQSRMDRNRRQDEIYQKIPEIRAIENEMRRTGAGITQAVVTSPQKAEALIQKLAKENQALQEKRERLLVDYGYPTNYLQPRHVCNICEDNGYVGTKRCECFSQLLQRQAFEQLSGIAQGDTMRFSTFRLDFYPDTPLGGSNIVPKQRMSDVYEFCRQYAKDFSMESDSLLMLGRTGLGKTHLSLSIAWEVIEKGYGVVYTPVQQLMDKLESNKFSYNPDQKERYSQDLNAVLGCDLLVLDDLGTEFNTSYTVATLYNIVNTRLVEQRPTIINTNLEPGELEKEYSQRMVSRLMFGYKPLRFFGEDIRLQKRQRRIGWGE